MPASALGIYFLSGLPHIFPLDRQSSLRWGGIELAMAGLCGFFYYYYYLFSPHFLWNQGNYTHIKRRKKSKLWRKKKHKSRNLPLGLCLGKRTFQNSDSVSPLPDPDSCQGGLLCMPGQPLIVSGGCCHFVLGCAWVWVKVPAADRSRYSPACLRTLVFLFIC